MSSVPNSQRGVASGVRSTFQNSGTALSIGVFFSVMVLGIAGSLTRRLTAGLIRHGVPTGSAAHIGATPPTSSLFAAVLGVNPLHRLLAANNALASLPRGEATILTGRSFFPELLSQAFHHGLVVVFAVAAGLSVIGMLASISRGKNPEPRGEASAELLEAPAEAFS